MAAAAGSDAKTYIVILVGRGHEAYCDTNKNLLLCFGSNKICLISCTALVCLVVLYIGKCGSLSFFPDSYRGPVI